MKYEDTKYMKLCEVILISKKYKSNVTKEMEFLIAPEWDKIVNTLQKDS